MDNPRWPLLWRLSATSTLTNQNFFALGLPQVNTNVYLAYSTLVPQSQGGQSRQGYININLLWDDMDSLQLKTLKSIVDAAITAGSVYMTIPKNDGSGLNAFIDAHGIARPVTFTPYSNGRDVMYQNVNLIVTNIVVDSDPSAIN